MFFQTWEMLIYDRKDAILNAKSCIFIKKKPDVKASHRVFGSIY
jgi:hypothetical protein